MTEAQFNALKKQVEEAKDRYQQAKGALAELLARLKAEFGVDSFEEGVKKHEELKETCRQLELELDQAYQAFQQKWEK